jgi:uncharacterized membrane protein
MIRSARRLAVTATLVTAVVLASSAPAHAYYQITNRTPNTVWLTHAYASTSGFLCGWNDGCSDATAPGWRVEGWWQIAPGGTAVIQSQNWGNAYHQIFAHDLAGHVWSGNGDRFATPDSVFNRCAEFFPPSNIPAYQYVWTSTHRCCGGSCPSFGSNTLIL